MRKLWEWTVRLRNWIITVIGALLLILPEVLSAPELLAVIPESWHKWVFLATMFLNLAVRWRPAVLSTDLEASISRSRRR